MGASEPRISIPKLFMQAPLLVNPAYYIEESHGGGKLGFGLDLGLRIRRIIRRWKQRVQRSLDLLARATQPRLTPLIGSGGRYTGTALAYPTWVDRAVFQMQYPAHLLRWLRTKTFTEMLSRPQYGGQPTSDLRGLTVDLKRKRLNYHPSYGPDSMIAREPELPAYLRTQSLVDRDYDDPDPRMAPNFTGIDRLGRQRGFTSHRSAAMRRRI